MIVCQVGGTKRDKCQVGGTKMIVCQVGGTKRVMFEIGSTKRVMCQVGGSYLSQSAPDMANILGLEAQSAEDA